MTECISPASTVHPTKTNAATIPKSSFPLYPLANWPNKSSRHHRKIRSSPVAGAAWANRPFHIADDDKRAEIAFTA